MHGISRSPAPRTGASSPQGQLGLHAAPRSLPAGTQPHLQSIKRFLTQHAWDGKSDLKPPPASSLTAIGQRSLRLQARRVQGPPGSPPSPTRPPLQRGGSLRKTAWGPLGEGVRQVPDTGGTQPPANRNQSHHGNALLPCTGLSVPKTSQWPHVQHISFISDSVQRRRGIPGQARLLRGGSAETPGPEDLTGWTHARTFTQQTHIHSHTCSHTRGHGASLGTRTLKASPDSPPKGVPPAPGTGTPPPSQSLICTGSGPTSPMTSPETSPASGPTAGTLSPKEGVVSLPWAPSPPLPPGAAPVPQAGSRLAATKPGPCGRGRRKPETGLQLLLVSAPLDPSPVTVRAPWEAAGPRAPQTEGAERSQPPRGQTCSWTGKLRHRRTPQGPREHRLVHVRRTWGTGLPVPVREVPTLPVPGYPYLAGGARPRPPSGHRLSSQLCTRPTAAPASRKRKQL